MKDAPARVLRLAAIVLRSKDPEALAGFYRAAFDFVDEPAIDDRGIETQEGRRTQALRLGDTHLRIEGSGRDAAPYPDDVPGWSPLFQHFAMRVADMDRAMARLRSIAGWRPISTDGPERLPPNTGNVTAFKFRDPEGHPLEFLALPDQRPGPLFAGIDHSAISVADVERSISFYEGLGLVVAGRSVNTGIEQSRLDGIEHPTVDVVSLQTPSRSVPHVELLGYRGLDDRRSIAPARFGDVAATRMLFDGRDDETDAVAIDRQRDPDGHLVESRARC